MGFQEAPRVITSLEQIPMEELKYEIPDHLIRAQDLVSAHITMGGIQKKEGKWVVELLYEEIVGWKYENPSFKVVTCEYEIKTYKESYFVTMNMGKDRLGGPIWRDVKLK